MKTVRFICAQPASIYYAWQVQVMLDNFLKHGVAPEQIDIVSQTVIHPTDGRPAWDALTSNPKYRGVRFSFYLDERKSKGYLSSIRPHILAKHFAAYPELQHEAVFYHDCDIVLTRPLDFSPYLTDDMWYASDTRHYIGAEYIKSKGFGIYENMCQIIDIDPALPVANEMNSGGAQYLMKNLNEQFWQKVECDCEVLYEFFLEHLKEYPESPTYHPIQKWTSDMWALLWNVWYFDHEIRVVSELDFAWATSPRAEWDQKAIFHNAGVVPENRTFQFFKGDFIDDSPLELFRGAINPYDPKYCSYLYFQEILATAKL